MADKQQENLPKAGAIGMSITPCSRAPEECLTPDIATAATGAPLKVSFNTQDQEKDSERLRELSQSLEGSHLQGRRMSQFAFEPVSLPASRVRQYPFDSIVSHRLCEIAGLSICEIFQSIHVQSRWCFGSFGEILAIPASLSMPHCITFTSPLSMNFGLAANPMKTGPFPRR